MPCQHCGVSIRSVRNLWWGFEQGVPVSGQNIRVSFNGSAPVTAALVNGEGSLQFTATTEGSIKP